MACLCPFRNSFEVALAQRFNLGGRQFSIKYALTSREDASKNFFVAKLLRQTFLEQSIIDILAFILYEKVKVTVPVKKPIP